MPKLNNTRFEEFEIGKLFKSQNGNFDIKKEHINGDGLPVITAGVDNYGILGNTDVDARVISKDTITVDMFGNVFYRPFEYKMVTHARVFSLEPISFKLSEGIGLYIVTCLKWFTQRFSYSDMCSYKKIKAMKMYLPVLDIIDPTCKYHKDGYIPDFEYMERYIAELEQERIAELEQYLIATGLNDYTLTDEDKAVLSLIESRWGNEITGSKNVGTVSEQGYKEFVIGELFVKENLKWRAKRKFNKKLDISQDMNDEFNLPLCNAKFGNNGIMYYGRKEDWDFVSGGIDIVNDGAISTGSVYPQPHDIGVLYNAYIVTVKDRNCNQQILEFLACVLEKAIKHKYGYELKASWDRVRNDKIVLPIQTDKNNNPIIDHTRKYHKDGYIPDFAFMERYIKAMEKVVIADVVKYKDGVIAQTKTLVNT